MNWSVLGWLGWACVIALFLWRFRSPGANGEVRTLHEPWEAAGFPPQPASESVDGGTNFPSHRRADGRRRVGAVTGGVVGRAVVERSPPVP